MRVRIGVLPSLVTLGNLVSGFAAIGMASKAQLLWKEAEWAAANNLPQQSTNLYEQSWESFALAGGLILLAMVFDVLDGKIARMSNQTTEFGAQLDSLCDMVSFGIAPAYVVFLEASSRGLFGYPHYAWAFPLFYAICTALRLARFNVETAPDEESHRFFRGLPCPGAAGVIASLAIVDWKSPEDARWAAMAMPFAAIVLGGLMISRIRYVHLLNVLFIGQKPFKYLAILVFAAFGVLALGPYLGRHYEYLLLAGFAGYVVSGLVIYIWSLIRHKHVAVTEPPGEPDAESDNDETAIF